MPIITDYIKSVVIPFEKTSYNYYPIKSKSNFLSEILPNSFGFLYVDGETLLIAIRGTENVREWLDDFEEFAVPCKFSKGYVHKGIQEIYYTIRDSILSVVLSAVRASAFVYKKIVILGHSLGGALAVLLLYELLSLGINPSLFELYTLNAPRVLLGDAAIEFNRLSSGSKLYRTEYKWDIVPHLPHSLVGYVSVGPGILVTGPFSFDIHVNHNLDTLLGGTWPDV